MEIFTYYNTGNIFEHLDRYAYEKYIYKNKLDRIEIARSIDPLSCAIIPGNDFPSGDDPRKAKVVQILRFVYSDNGDLEQKRNYFIIDGAEQLVGYQKYLYEGNTVVRQEVYTPQDQLTNYFDYTYDSIGNVLKEAFYAIQEDGSAVLQHRIITEFDTMHNPFRVFAVEGTPGINTNVNNIVRRTDLIYTDTEVRTFEDENRYEYNALGYPIRVNGQEYTYGQEE